MTCRSSFRYIHERGSDLLEAGFPEQLESAHNLILMEPMGYIEFMSLVCDAKLVITNSGGLQEETTYLKIPCLTLRDSTERPITITLGTNELVRVGEIKPAVDRNSDGKMEKWKVSGTLGRANCFARSWVTSVAHKSLV